MGKDADKTITVTRCLVGKTSGDLGDSLVNSFVKADNLVEVLLFAAGLGLSPQSQDTGAKRAIFRDRMFELEAGVKPHTRMCSGYPVKGASIRILALAFVLPLR
jgi:hypothetical protein